MKSKSTIGTKPYAIAIDNLYIWVVCRDASVWGYKIESETMYTINIPNVSFNDTPYICSDNINIWITNPIDNKVYQILISLIISQTPTINTIIVGSNPKGICSDGLNIWVANYGDDTISQINCSNGVIINTISSEGHGPFSLYSDSSNVWVSNYASNIISKIKIQQNIISVGPNPLIIKKW